MKNKKKVQYSWQALLLCIFVSVSYLALAKLSSASSTEKHNPRKPTNAKKKPPASATKGSSVSTPIRPTSQRQQRVQKEKKLKQDQPSVSISREKYQPVDLEHLINLLRTAGQRRSAALLLQIVQNLDMSQFLRRPNATLWRRLWSHFLFHELKPGTTDGKRRKFHCGNHLPRQRAKRV